MNRLNFVLLIVIIFFMGMNSGEISAQSASKPIRLAVAGVNHGHASFILGRKDKGDFTLVGVCDTNKELVQRYSKRFGFSDKLIYHDLNQMLDKEKPKAVVAFGSIYDHMAVVEACAPRGIHVMVEKPLATTVEHAQKMLDLARKYHIFLLTDYETSWYPTTAKSFELVNDSVSVGKLRKVVIHDGHQGPKEIGCGKEFLDWLTDPVLNGGGAMIDFGCYGANLMTCLKKGVQPVSVTAVAQHYKPDVYPKVEDDATILVTYPDAQCIIQASWNWPFSRKDMEIYGDNGYVITSNQSDMRLRNGKMKTDRLMHVTSQDVKVYEDPFTYFADVIHGKIKMKDFDLYAPENNLMVVRILDAARESVKSGKTIFFNK